MSKIEDSDYKPDFEILDRYLNFSAELLRISLLAIGGFGAILLIRVKGEDKGLTVTHLTLFYYAVLFFALTAAASLFHRYFASDSMSWYIIYLRKKADDQPEKAKEAQKGLHRMFKASSISLIITEVCFGIAVFIFSLAIFRMMQ